MLFVTACLIWMPFARASDAKPLVTLKLEKREAPQGQPATVQLIALNTLDYELTYTAPKKLRGELAANGATFPVELILTTVDEDDDDRDVIPAQGFLLYTYEINMPAGVATGSAILTVCEPELLRAVFDVVPPPPPGAATTNLEKQNEAQKPAGAASIFASEFAFGHVDSRQTTSKVKRGFLQNFALYEPIYFIAGFDKPAAKFQFSFQYQILANEGSWARAHPFLKGLCFSYTQRSLWDITGNSSPFYDTSYMPEFFYAITSTSTKRFLGFRWLGAQAGFGHESNGRDGPESRSMNKLYLRAAFATGNLDGWRLIVIPKIWTYVGDMSDNPNLNDYRGYGEMQLNFGKNDSLNIGLFLRAGQSFQYGAMQLDVTYPIDALYKNFAAYFLVQYWNGYGESLLNYYKHTQTVRFGISLVR